MIGGLIGNLHSLLTRLIIGMRQGHCEIKEERLCPMGFDDCDNLSGNGCEAPLATDLSNCGACGTVCPAVTNAARTCSMGSCGFTCTAPFGDCNGSNTDGCETNTSSTVLHCGGCNTVCPTTDGVAVCASGACRTERCNDELKRDCNGDAADGCEVDTATDPANCGGCGRKCAAAGTTRADCRAGRCDLVCSEDRGDCDDRADNGCEAELASEFSE